MITPLTDHPPEPHGGSVPPGENSRERARLARQWAYLLNATTYIPLSPVELERHMLELVNRLYEAVRSEPFSTRPAAGVGARLVELNCTGRTSLLYTLDVLGKALLEQPELQQIDQLAERVVLLLGRLATDYAEAVRLLTFQQQERLNSALRKATRTAQRKREGSEAWFDELATCSAGGIVITDVDGSFLQTNRTFQGILGIADSPRRLSLFDLVHPADVAHLRAAYRNLLDGDVPQLPLLRLLGPKEQTRWASFTVSLLRSAEGRPERYLVMIDDRAGVEARSAPVAEEATSAAEEPATVTEEEEPARTAHSEVRTLGTQSNPHFIYNVLTTITMFVRTDPARAQELLVEFAEFARYSSGEIGEFITLGEELRNVDRYLILEQARFGERLQVHQQISAAVLSVRLPFLTVQRLVENAVRHGTEGNKLGGSVTITAADSGTDCLITIEDTGTSHRPGDRGGCGDLDDLDERLRVAFGDDYGLVVDTTPEIGTKVTLRVPRSRGGAIR